MCEKCQELDAKIEHRRRIMARPNDDYLAVGLGKQTEEMEAEKAALHQSPP